MDIRKLPPIKIVYIFSLAALGVLLILTVFMPMATGKEYSTVQKEQVTKTKEGWLVKFELVNGDKEQQSFTFQEMLGDGESYRGSVAIPGGGAYTFINQVYAKDVTEGKVTYNIYKN
ncbi:MAG: hypothetical protein M1543_02980, partial [Firmicutes bacterium]|nr:hypothetical protein [Bacillota bacterium]